MGEPVEKEGMQFSPAYLTGIEMDKHPAGMSMDPKAIHIEIDIHAAKGEKHGFPDDAWIPYVTALLTFEKEGTKYKESKVLAPITAGDGPHYANNFEMDEPGMYKVIYAIDPPSSNGFIRHVDKELGVPEWWKPIEISPGHSTIRASPRRIDAAALSRPFPKLKDPFMCVLISSAVLLFGAAAALADSAYTPTNADGEDRGDPEGP